MTTESLYRFRCDAPHCTAVAIGEKISDLPDGWRILGSGDHITGSRTVGRGRTRVLAQYERCIGEFWLHLCGEHTDVFNDHLPHTEGIPGGRGRDSMVTVSCSCGPAAWRVANYTAVSGDFDGPRNFGERAWWSHLPADLQWYAQRGESA